MSPAPVTIDDLKSWVQSGVRWRGRQLESRAGGGTVHLDRRADGVGSTWFSRVPERFGEFRTRYHDKPTARSEPLEEVRTRAAKARLTPLCAAHRERHNNAAVLAELLRDG